MKRIRKKEITRNIREDKEKGIRLMADALLFSQETNYASSVESSV